MGIMARYVRQRRNITWKNPPTSVELKPAPFLGPTVPHDVGGDLTIGALWFTAAHMTVRNEVTDPYLRGTKQHAIPYLFPWGNTSSASVKPGTIALYVGTTRIEEAESPHEIPKRVLRHVFVIDGRKFMISNLNWLSPTHF